MTGPILSTPSLVHGIGSCVRLRPGHWVVVCLCGDSWTGPGARRSGHQHVAWARWRLAQLRIAQTAGSPEVSNGG